MDEQNPKDGINPTGSDVDDALALILGTNSERSSGPSSEVSSASKPEESSALRSELSSDPDPDPDSNPDPADNSPEADDPLLDIYDEGDQQKKPIWPLVVTALIVFIVVTGSLTFYLRTTMAQQAAELAAIKTEGDSYLNESISLIQEADAVVIAFDTASENQVTEESLPQLEALLDQVSATEQTLDNAIEKAELAQNIYVTEEDDQLAQYAIDAANARKDMLALSSQLTAYDIAAMQCAIFFNRAWDLIFAADADMRSAVEAVNAGGNGAVSEAVEYNRTAQDKILEAEQAIVTAGERFPGVDFTSISDYLTAKKESVALAIASDEALLNDDIDAANNLNDQFVAKDGEAVELAGLIPEDPMSLIVSAYDTATNALKTSYSEARGRAADADAFLRAYVGVEVLTFDTSGTSGTSPASDTSVSDAPVSP